MHLMFLVNIAIILGHAFQCELVHHVYSFAALKILLDESLDLDGVSSRKEHYLSRRRQEVDDLLDNWLKIYGQQLVRFV